MMNSDSAKYKVNIELDKEKIFNNILKFCTYQERAESEVKEKLKKYKLSGIQTEKILKKLKEEKFIDNQRFARIYAGGKFRNNQWGKVKIRYELMRRSINENFIEEALELIDEYEYKQMIRKLIRKKLTTVQEEDRFILRNKIAHYIFTKGFESELVWEMLNKEIQ